jgi:hypothetical protein
LLKVTQIAGMLLPGATDLATPSQSNGSTGDDRDRLSMLPEDVASSGATVAHPTENLNVGTNDEQDSLDKESNPALEDTVLSARQNTITLQIVTSNLDHKQWVFPLELCRTWPVRFCHNESRGYYADHEYIRICMN